MANINEITKVSLIFEIFMYGSIQVTVYKEGADIYVSKYEGADGQEQASILQKVNTENFIPLIESLMNIKLEKEHTDEENFYIVSENNEVNGIVWELSLYDKQNKIIYDLTGTNPEEIGYLTIINILIDAYNQFSEINKFYKDAYK